MEEILILAEEIRFPEKGALTKERKNKAISYLLSFVDTFENKVLNNIHASIIKTKFISQKQIETLEERSKLMTIEEINNPYEYINKYLDLLLELRCSVIYSDWKKDTKLDLIQFYERFGYLTSKQIAYAHSLFDNAIPPNIKRALLTESVFEAINLSLPAGTLEMNIQIILNHLSFSGKKKVYEQITQEISPKDKLSVIESQLRSLFVKEEIFKSKNTNSQTEEKIYKKFLSLNEMRAALTFVSK